MTPKILLTLIAKNDQSSHEGHCIERLLNSCEDIIDGVVAVTTSRGIAKGPVFRMIRDWCQTHNKTSHCAEDNWLDDFSRARNHALDMASLSKADWLLLLDCDEVLHIPADTDWSILVQPDIHAITIPLLLDGKITTRVTMIRNEPGWRFHGRIHEDPLYHDQPTRSEFFGCLNSPTIGPHITTPCDGARSQDPNKASRDLMMLSKALDETGNQRYRFFLGMTHATMGEWVKASRYLMEFGADQTNSIGHRYAALIQAARADFNAGLTHEPLQTLYRAFELVPSRPEALCELALWHGKRGEWATTKLYALAAVVNAHPTVIDLLEPEWLAWRAIDILTVALINLHQLDLAASYLRLLLNLNTTPADQLPRIKEHLEAAEGRLTSNPVKPTDPVAMLRQLWGTHG